MALKQEISVVWFKRDLRLRDNPCLEAAIKSGLPLLLLYIVEPEQEADPHFDIRHWRFIYQSIVDLNEQLDESRHSIHIVKGSAIEVLQAIQSSHVLKHLFSHEEVGLAHTFERDKAVKQHCENTQVHWHECENGAVYRRLTNRASWATLWNKRILAPLSTYSIEDATALSLKDCPSLTPYIFNPPTAWQQANDLMQLGGEKRAWFTLKHFFKVRGKSYYGNIGNPTVARETCSRLSPYLAWGNISLKQVYQYTLKQEKRPGWARSISALQSRLHWHCHFIQKFESECEMQFRAVNKAYEAFPYCDGDDQESRLNAWKQAKTGVPIVDACMKAVCATGYLNFRMRAMLVSFLCHHLNVDWRLGATYLGAQFLDFEPGIHYPQFQMQAGVTGVNTLRIYNPVKQSIDKDPDAIFIKKWLPELNNLPAPIIHQPWELSPMEFGMYDFDLMRDYCPPIVDIEQAAREARDRMWAFKSKVEVKKEASRILSKHTV